MLSNEDIFAETQLFETQTLNSDSIPVFRKIFQHFPDESELVSGEAWSVMLLHCSKYPQDVTCGLLIGDGKKVLKSVPLSHTLLTSAICDLGLNMVLRSKDSDHVVMGMYACPPGAAQTTREDYETLVVPVCQMYDTMSDADQELFESSRFPADVQLSLPEDLAASEALSQAHDDWRKRDGCKAFLLNRIGTYIDSLDHVVRATVSSMKFTEDPLLLLIPADLMILNADYGSSSLPTGILFHCGKGKMTNAFFPVSRKKQFPATSMGAAYVSKEDYAYWKQAVRRGSAGELTDMDEWLEGKRENWIGNDTIVMEYRANSKQD